MNEVSSGLKETLKEFIVNKKFYEFEQRIKTFIFRYNAKKNYAQSAELLKVSLN